MRKGVRSKDRALSRQSLDQMWLHAKDELDRLILGLAGDCGLRRGEIAHSTRYWVRFDDGDIVIPDRDNGWTPKTKAGARLVPVSMLSTRAWEATVYYFKYNERVGVSERTINYRVARIANLANIDTFPHALRATSATNIVRYVKGDPFALCAIMGWEDLDWAMSYVKASGVLVKDALRSARGLSYDR